MQFDIVGFGVFKDLGVLGSKVEVTQYLVEYV